MRRMRHSQDTPPAPATPCAVSVAAPRAGKTVLLVAGEPFVQELMATHLRAVGCFPMAVASAEEGQRLAAQVVPDMIVIDADAVSTPPADWAVQLARATKGKTVHTVMLSCSVLQFCGNDGLQCGASLCVAKPFEPRELMRQLLRLLRISRGAEGRARAKPALKAASIELDLDQPTLRLLRPDGWQMLDLPWTEHRLLAFLLANAERARSREEIRDAVWGEAPVDLRTVDQYVRRLRQSLDAAGARGLVKTVRGVGYRLELGALRTGTRRHA
ncbi:MAG: winged-helix domain-containing protein [Rubrivivax sp.]|nr:winged-helix domain-containing protein [Rubrivivax sp.]